MPIEELLVDGRNQGELAPVCRDILWMYYDLATSYGAIGHNVDFEPVDYRRFLLARAADPADRAQADLAALLRRGSAVALCCHLYNLLCDEQRDAALSGFLAELLRTPAAQGAPEIRLLAESAHAALAEPPHWNWETLPGGRALLEQMQGIYRAYVASFFESLARRATERNAPT